MDTKIENLRLRANDAGDDDVLELLEKFEQLTDELALTRAEVGALRDQADEQQEQGVALTEYQRDGIIDAMGAVSLKNYDLAYEKLRALLAQAQPVSADDARDAERYRWIKMTALPGEQSELLRTPWGKWDAYCDTAIAALNGDAK